MIVPIGKKTKFGKVAAVLFTVGERYYMLLDKGTVSLLPASVVEKEDDYDLSVS